MTDAIMHDTIHQSGAGDFCALARTTRSDPRKVVAGKTEGLLYQVLRTCGSLVKEDTYGLSLVD